MTFTRQGFAMQVKLFLGAIKDAAGRRVAAPACHPPRTLRLPLKASSLSRGSKGQLAPACQALGLALLVGADTLGLAGRRGTLEDFRGLEELKRSIGIP